jgi:Protein of unknown function (DUF2752)
VRPALEHERRVGALLVAGGCLPFAAGGLAGEAGLGIPCPFRAATGVPCPLCGATRAFALAARGDGALLRYNAAWVAFAALAVLAGLAALAASLAGRAPLLHARARLARAAWSPPRVVAAVALVVALPWAYALLQRDAIAGG